MKEKSAGGVVYSKDGEEFKILMIKDRTNKWTLPKGKIEQGETIEQTALREIKEETGIDGVLEKPLDKVYYEYYSPLNEKIEKEVNFFLVKALTDSIEVQVSEINGSQWLSPEEAWNKQINYGYENNHNILQQAFRELGIKIN